MKVKQKIKKLITMVIVYSLLAGLLVPVLGRTEKVMADENSVSVQMANCPHGGKPEEIAWMGCSACMNPQGSGVEWFYTGNALDVYPELGNQGEEYDFGDSNVSGGSGLTSEEKIIDGTKWTIYYRCYNCGVCKKNDLEVYRVSESGIRDDSFQEAETSTGYVPVRWCSECGPNIYKMGYKTRDVCYTEAKWNQYHLPVTYRLTVVANKGGDISLAGGSFVDATHSEYRKGEKVKVEAKADEGYEFSHWSDEGGTEKGNNNPYTVVMPEANYTLYANFTVKEKTKYTVTVTAGDGGQAAVNKDSFYEGEEVILNATAKTGYVFAGWTGYDTGNDDSETVSFSMPAKNIAVRANFKQVDITPVPEPTSVPVVATPNPSPTVTPVPVKGITVTFDPDGGYVSPESKNVETVALIQRVNA